MHIEQKVNRIFKPQSNTTLSAEESNQVTTEIENQILAGGLTPNAGTLTQLRDSIQAVVDTSANALQSQIDTITSASDVFDVVGTYAQLQAYDTSTVPVNDIIKVLQDETRQNAMTYYRWNGTTWVFIGAEGPYYTVAESDTKFATKTQLPGIATTQQAGLVKPDGQTVFVGQDGTMSVSQTMAASLPLFTNLFADHLLNDASYLRADTFSWQSGAVYISGYNHLVSDISGITAETETISGTTVTFYRAADGHKICLADQESNIQDIYTATGVAWYYILDTANTRFKLPRSQHGNIVDKGQSGSMWYKVWSDGWCEQGGLYDNGSDVAVYNGTITFLKPFKDTNYTALCTMLDGAGQTNINLSNKTTTSITITATPNYGTSPVQRYAFWEAKGYITGYQTNEQYKYLYFYVGNTVQSQTTIDVGQITEALNGKVDISNLPSGGVVGFMDTSAPVAITSGYITPSAGWIYIYGDGTGSNDVINPVSLMYDGITVWTSGVSARDGRDGVGNFGVPLPVAAGVTVTATRAITLEYLPNL